MKRTFTTTHNSVCTAWPRCAWRVPLAEEMVAQRLSETRRVTGGGAAVQVFLFIRDGGHPRNVRDLNAVTALVPAASRRAPRPDQNHWHAPDRSTLVDFGECHEADQYRACVRARWITRPDVAGEERHVVVPELGDLRKGEGQFPRANSSTSPHPPIRSRRA